MALTPIAYTEDVVSNFLRYQLTTYAFADAELYRQMRELLNLEDTGVASSPFIIQHWQFPTRPPASSAG